MTKKFAAKDTIQGEIVASVAGHFVLVKTRKTSPHNKVLQNESASLLLAAGRALARPGISRNSVFGIGHKKVYAYSLDPNDPTRIIREAQDGTRHIGRMVKDKFKALARA
jgi:hypothetical protein